MFCFHLPHLEATSRECEWNLCLFFCLQVLKRLSYLLDSRVIHGRDVCSSFIKLARATNIPQLNQQDVVEHPPGQPRVENVENIVSRGAWAWDSCWTKGSEVSFSSFSICLFASWTHRNELCLATCAVRYTPAGSRSKQPVLQPQGQACGLFHYKEYFIPNDINSYNIRYIYLICHNICFTYTPDLPKTSVWDSSPAEEDRRTGYTYRPGR